jgi:CRP/FNR family transcriptional regulator
MTSGAERIIFIYGPGDIFPLTSYLSGAGVARYFYECMTDAEVQMIPAQTFGQKLHDEVAVGETLLYYINSVNLDFYKRVDILSVNDARRKVVATFAFLANKLDVDADKVKLDMPLTSQDVADMCGITRETASLQLHRLREKGVISGYRNIFIHTKKLKKLMKKLDILAD